MEETGVWSGMGILAIALMLGLIALAIGWFVAVA
jgi:hypothetical protein